MPGKNNKIRWHLPELFGQSSQGSAAGVFPSKKASWMVQLEENTQDKSSKSSGAFFHWNMKSKRKGNFPITPGAITLNPDTDYNTSSNNNNKDTNNNNNNNNNMNKIYESDTSRQTKNKNRFSHNNSPQHKFKRNTGNKRTAQEAGYPGNNYSFEHSPNNYDYDQQDESPAQKRPRLTTAEFVNLLEQSNIDMDKLQQFLSSYNPSSSPSQVQDSLSSSFTSNSPPTASNSSNSSGSPSPNQFTPPVQPSHHFSYNEPSVSCSSPSISHNNVIRSLDLSSGISVGNNSEFPLQVDKNNPSVYNNISNITNDHLNDNSNFNNNNNTPNDSITQDTSQDKPNLKFPLVSLTDEDIEDLSRRSESLPSSSSPTRYTSQLLRQSIKVVSDDKTPMDVESIQFQTAKERLSYQDRELKKMGSSLAEAKEKYDDNSQLILIYNVHADIVYLNHNAWDKLSGNSTESIGTKPVFSSPVLADVTCHVLSEFPPTYAAQSPLISLTKDHKIKGIISFKGHCMYDENNKPAGYTFVLRIVQDNQDSCK